MSSCLTSGSDGKGFKPFRVQRYKKYLEYARKITISFGGFKKNNNLAANFEDIVIEI